MRNLLICFPAFINIVIANAILISSICSTAVPLEYWIFLTVKINEKILLKISSCSSRKNCPLLSHFGINSLWLWAWSFLLGNQNKEPGTTKWGVSEFPLNSAACHFCSHQTIGYHDKNQSDFCSHQTISYHNKNQSDFYFLAAKQLVNMTRIRAHG